MDYITTAVMKYASQFITLSVM